MAMGKIKEGPYGKYYNYYLNGKYYNLSLKDQGEYLQPNEIDELIEKEEVTFEANGKVYKAILKEYYNSYKHEKAKKIVYKETGEVATPPDPKDIEILTSDENKEQYFDILSNNTDYYSRKKIDDHIQSLKLSKIYYSTIIPTDVNEYGIRICIFEIYYKENNEPKTVFSMYIKYDTSKGGYKRPCKEISKSEYLEDLNAQIEKKKAIKAEQEKYEQECLECKKQAEAYLNDLSSKIWQSSGSLDTNALVIALEPIVAGIEESNLNVTYAYLYIERFKEMFSDIPKYIDENIFKYNYSMEEKRYHTPQESLKYFKRRILWDLRFLYDYYRTRNVRLNIAKDVKNNGLEFVVDGIPIDQALDLGRFKEFKAVMKKGTADAVDEICMNMYMDITDPNKLKESILYMLKTYEAFFDIKDKNIKSIAKFVAANDLKEYFDKVSEFDEAVEVLLKEGSPSLRKKLMRNLAGTARLDALHLDKTFFIERKLKIRDNIIVNDPLKLLDELRSLIPNYNAGSDVAILTNIILSADGKEFTYQFYTFTEDSNGDDIDGRRVQYLTRLYNQCHSTPIYFDYL